MKTSEKSTRRLPLYALYAATVISVSGSVMAFIAIPWFVLQTTGSASQTGLTAAVTALPAIIAAFFGGVLVDRIGYKRTSILADLASGIAIALIPLLYAITGLAFWQLLVLVFVGNLLDAPGQTARAALTPDLADLAGLPLERVAAFNDAVSRSARFIGAPLGGVLIALVGTNNVLWIDAATFLVSAILIGLCVPGAKAAPRGEAPRRYFDELTEGLRFLLNDRVLRTIVAAVLITNLLDAAMGAVILPIYVNRVYGDPAVLGLITGLIGGAAFLCALLIGAKGIPRARRLVLGVAFTIVGTRFWLLALFPSLPVLLVLCFGIGLAVGFLNPILTAVEFERIPAAMRARVFGVVTAGAMFGMPLGGLSGPIIDQIGLAATLIIMGAVYMLVTSSLLFNPTIREIDKPVPATLVAEAAGK